jgi:hypothetical protein
MAEKRVIEDADDIGDLGGPESAQEPQTAPVSKADQKRDAEKAAERLANRVGPIHPNHWQHAQWLADRGLDESWDKAHGPG